MRSNSKSLKFNVAESRHIGNMYLAILLQHVFRFASNFVFYRRNRVNNERITQIISIQKFHIAADRYSEHRKIIIINSVKYEPILTEFDTLTHILTSKRDVWLKLKL